MSHKMVYLAVWASASHSAHLTHSLLESGEVKLEHTSIVKISISQNKIHLSIPWLWIQSYSEVHSQKPWVLDVLFVFQVNICLDYGTY